jgi:perosamine synthetase
MDRLMAISADTGIPILEDCAHAHGARYGENIVGSIGHVGIWSLQGSKAVSAGEGGMLATNDSEIFERACLAGQVNRMGGLDLVGQKYADFQPLGLGMKFRAHPLGIGIASVQFEKLNDLNQRRKAYVEAVETRIKELPGLKPVKVYDKVERGGYYAFPVIHEPELHRGLPTAQFLQMVQAEGLKCASSPYGLLHRLKLFAEGFDVFTRKRGPLCGDYRGYQEGDFPVAEGIHEHLIFLPMLSDPVPNAVDKVMAMLQRAVDRAMR